MVDRHHHHRHNEEVILEIDVTVPERHKKGHHMNGQTPQELAQQLITDAQTLEAALSSESPSTNDQVATAVVQAVNTAGLVTVFGADTLQNALEAAGYTVSAPATPADGSTTDSAPTS
jgi:hypothetical protein